MLVPPPSDPMSMFVNGKLRPGVYKVQNLSGHTFLEILEDSKEWEFQTLGSGYKIKKVDSGNPDQFCNPLGGLFFGFGSGVSATAFPAAWRVELVDDIQYRGFGYIRIFWGSTNKAMELNWWGSSKDGTTIRLWEHIGCHPWCIWKLTPVQADGSSMELDDRNDVLLEYSSKR